MRASPHQSDEQQKEAYNLLLQEEEEETPHRKSFNCEDPLIKQLLSSKLSSDPSSPKDLPTFVAPQGLHSLQLPHTKECKKSEGHDRCTQNDHHSRHLVPLCEEDAFTPSLVDPPSDFHKNTHSRVCSLLQSKPRKQNAHENHHPRQKLSYKQSGSINNSIYGLVLERTMSVHETGGEKKRRSSASARDMISSEDAVMRKNRFCDVQSSSWEDEVRQAMAKNSLSKRQTEEAYKGGGVGCGLQRSNSVKEYGISALPPTLIVKQPDGRGNVDAAICAEESGAKLMHDTVMGGHAPPHSKGTAEKRMWKGFNVVKSPSEERWEEAAQDEERQEMQRRARSQSMRYDTSLRTSDLAGISRSEALVGGNALYNDDEWAVYTRCGYINVRPRRSDADAMAPCCSSLMGRSMSMRDTRMGLVMECAACGTSLNGSGGRLLCFCSCCAAARASTQAGTPASNKKKGGAGILRACRRLFGLSKKRPSKPQLI